MRIWNNTLGLTVIALLGFAACGGDDHTPSPAAGGSSAGGGGTGGGGGASAEGGTAGEAGGFACDSPSLEQEIEIAGAYRDNYSGMHRVTDESWTSGASSFQVIEFSNDERSILARNDGENEFNPGAYSRFDWTVAGEMLYFCQSAYAAETADEARDAPAADPDDLPSGCGAGGFAWSLLTSISLLGNYGDDFGGSHQITPGVWGSSYASFHLVEFSNDEKWVVAQNDCGNPYFPGLFSRFDWITLDEQTGGGGAGGAGSEDSLYYCQIGYDLASAEAAEAIDEADRADLDTGCNGFPWTQLTATE
jgi:hypothetical protein